MSPRLSSPMHPTQGAGGGGGGGNNAGGGRGRGMGRGRGGGSVGRDRDLIGQTIKITQGPYKSHVGIVKVHQQFNSRNPKKLIQYYYYEPCFYKI